jgi:hypothetical protein
LLSFLDVDAIEGFNDRLIRDPARWAETKNSDDAVMRDTLRGEPIQSTRITTPFTANIRGKNWDAKTLRFDKDRFV